MEAKVLAAIANDRAAFEYVRAFIQETDFSERGWRLYSEVASYYDLDAAAKAVDWDIILNRIGRALPSEKLLEQFTSAVEIIEGLEVSAANIAQEFLELRRSAVGSRLARNLEIGGERAEIYALHEEYGELLDATELGTAAEVQIDLYELFNDRLADAAKTQILPGLLSKTIGGGLRPGDTVVVFGRPNAGKSTFALNAASGFVRRGLKVLFVENEDSRERTLSRFVRRLIERDEPWCVANASEAKRLAIDAGRERFYLYKLTPGSPSEIEALVRRLRPDVLMVNQIRAIAHSMPGKLTPNLEKAMVSIRNIGQRYDLITMVMTQANANQKDKYGNVIDKPVLYMEDMDSSLTGIPGATDFIFGIGTSRSLKNQNTMCISVAKSKAAGDGEHIYVGVEPNIDKLTSAPPVY